MMCYAQVSDSRSCECQLIFMALVTSTAAKAHLVLLIVHHQTLEPRLVLVQLQILLQSLSA